MVENAATEARFSNVDVCYLGYDLDEIGLEQLGRNHHSAGARESFHHKKWIFVVMVVGLLDSSTWMFTFMAENNTGKVKEGPLVFAMLMSVLKWYAVLSC